MSQVMSQYVRIHVKKRNLQLRQSKMFSACLLLQSVRHVSSSTYVLEEEKDQMNVFILPKLDRLQTQKRKKP